MKAVLHALNDLVHQKLMELTPCRRRRLGMTPCAPRSRQPGGAYPAMWRKPLSNARATPSMRELLRRKTWVQMVKSIERMDVASRLARRGMREARQKAAEATGKVE